MATKKSNKTITNIFGSVAAAQTMVEQFPFSFGVNESGFTCTFDMLASLFNMVSDEPLDEKIINVISEKISDQNDSWLQSIEESVKLALELNLTNLITCDMSPIIPDRLISDGKFMEGTPTELNFQGSGVTIPLSAIDFTGVLGNCPSDENNPVSTTNYFSCYGNKFGYKPITENLIPDNITPVILTEIPNENKGEYIKVNDNFYVWRQSLLGVTELWKHDDFNAFLWYVKNKGIYNNLNERNKLIWDNRYKTKPYTKYKRKPENFFTKEHGSYGFTGTTGVVPFDEGYLEQYNADASYKKRQILECRYIDGEGIQSDSIQFRLPASNYYKTRKISDGLYINKTIFEFNHDFLMSLKLFDAKTYLCQLVSGLLGVGNISFNFSVTRDSIQIEEIIDSIIEKVINLSDIEIEDCYYTFSNEEYDQMLQNALLKRQYKNDNSKLSASLIDEIKTIENNGTSVEKTKTTITNVLTELTKETKDAKNIPNGWRLNYNYQFELIRMLVYPLVRPLFSPKVMTLILLNLEIMGDPLKLKEGKTITFEDIKPYFMGILTNIIIQLKDIINEMLYTWVIEKLTPLLTLFSLRVIMEQIEMYRQLIMDMITACSGSFSFGFGNKNKKRVSIDTIDYVDIDPQLEQLKQTSNSKSNC